MNNTDKIKILNYGRALQAVSAPDLKTEEAKAIFSNVLDLMSKLDIYITKEAEKL